MNTALCDFRYAAPQKNIYLYILTQKTCIKATTIIDNNSQMQIPTITTVSYTASKLNKKPACNNIYLVLAHFSCTFCSASSFANRWRWLHDNTQEVSQLIQQDRTVHSMHNSKTLPQYGQYGLLGAVCKSKYSANYSLQHVPVLWPPFRC